jgi:dihydrofolate reductase
MKKRRAGRAAARRPKGPRRRRIVASLAVSADGFLARPDGAVDWLDRPRTAGDYGMAAFYRTIDTILFGRKTYEVALKFQAEGIPGAEFDPKIAYYVFSRRPPREPAPGVTFVKEGVGAFAKRLRAAPGKDVWMMGGGGIIASFLDAGEIDELVLHVIPTLLGEGIPLVASLRRDAALRLVSSRRYSDGVVRLRYAVERAGGKRKRG